LVAVGIEEGRELHLPGGAVEADQLADAEAEVVPVRLREVADLVLAHVHAAGGDLVQLGFPDMGAGAVDQGDLCLAAASERVAESSGELEPAGAAADDDDAMRRLSRLCVHERCPLACTAAPGTRLRPPVQRCGSDSCRAR